MLLRHLGAGDLPHVVLIPSGTIGTLGLLVPAIPDRLETPVIVTAALEDICLH
jgi:hypothetical protein